MPRINSHFNSPSGLHWLSPKCKVEVSKAPWDKVADRGETGIFCRSGEHRSPHTIMASWSSAQLPEMHPRQGPAYMTLTSLPGTWTREDKAGLNSHTLGLLQVEFRHRVTVPGQRQAHRQAELHDVLGTHSPRHLCLSMNHSSHCRLISNHLSPFIPSKICVLQSSHFRKSEALWNLLQRLIWMTLLAEPHGYPDTTNWIAEAAEGGAVQKYIKILNKC